MYVQAAFAIDTPEGLAAVIGRAPFVSLVVAGPEGLEAAHLPMLYDPQANMLLGHVARRNPMAARDGAEAMAILMGPNAYISPSYYPSKAEHGRVVRLRGTVQDITERRRMELELSRHRTHLEEQVQSRTAELAVAK